MKLLFSIVLVSTLSSVAAPPPSYSYMSSGSKSFITEKRISPPNQPPVWQFWRHDIVTQTDLYTMRWSWREFNNETFTTTDDGYILTRVFQNGKPMDEWQAWVGWHSESETWHPGSGQPFTGTTNWFYASDFPYVTRDSVPFAKGITSTVSLDNNYRYTIVADSEKTLVNTDSQSVWVWRQWFKYAPLYPLTGIQVCVPPNGTISFTPKMGNQFQTYPYVYAVDQWNQHLSTCSPWQAP